MELCRPLRGLRTLIQGALQPPAEAGGDGSFGRFAALAEQRDYDLDQPPNAAHDKPPNVANDQPPNAAHDRPPNVAHKRPNVAHDQPPKAAHDP